MVVCNVICEDHFRDEFLFLDTFWPDLFDSHCMHFVRCAYVRKAMFLL